MNQPLGAFVLDVDDARRNLQPRHAHRDARVVDGNQARLEIDAKRFDRHARQLAPQRLGGRLKLGRRRDRVVGDDDVVLGQRLVDGVQHEVVVVAAERRVDGGAELVGCVDGGAELARCVAQFVVQGVVKAGRLTHQRVAAVLQQRAGVVQRGEGRVFKGRRQ